MIDPNQITQARRALGRQLAAYRQAAGYNQHRFAPLTHYGRSTIANVETGRQKVPRAFWQRCDEVLATDGALVRDYDKLELLVAQQQRELAALAGHALSTGASPPSLDDDGATAAELTRERSAAPLKLNLSTAAEVAAVLDHLREQWHVLVRTDNLLGPRHALSGVLGQLAIIDALLWTTRGESRVEVAQLAARYAESAAWLYEDLGDAVRARYWTGVAMERAHEADDALMVRWTLFRLSQQATTAHDAGQARGLARAAGRDGERLPVLMRAAITQQEAKGHALDGDERAAHDLLDQAHTWTATSDAGDARQGHGSFCTPSYLEIQRAWCWQTLGQPQRAIALYETALPGLPAVYQRDRGAALAGLATAYTASGEPEQAATVAVQALRIARSSGSSRVHRSVVKVGQTLGRFQELPPVKILLGELAQPAG